MTGTSRSGGNRTMGFDRSKSDGGPIKPSDLSEDVANVWDELLGQLPSHVLRKIDVHQLRNLSTLVAMSRTLATTILEDPADLKTQRVYHATVDRIHRLSAAFGLTPADRRRLNLQDEPVDGDPDEWSDYQ